LDDARWAAQPFRPVRKNLPLLVSLLVLGVVFGLVLPCPVSAAERKEVLAPVPPPAQPLAVKVKRGEPTEIALRIFGKKNETLKYLIRTEPQHGKVTAPKPVEREVSTVVYTPPADLAITRDRFTYAVQNSAGVSASVEVAITIVDEPPALALPEMQDFGSVLAGATAAKTIEIRNRGGGVAEGKVTVSEPWKIQGPATYRLGAGERASFQLIFAPTVGGDGDGTVRFSSEPETSVVLRGVALAALAASPAKVALQNAAGDPVRTGSFELSNQTEKERRARLNAGPRLQVLTEVIVPAQGKVSVPVQTAAADVAALSGEVRVDSEGLILSVPVVAAPVGGIVRATRPTVSFGRIDATKTADSSFELENIGGALASVSWEIVAPFATDEAGTVLAPGEKKTVAIHTRPAEPGKYRAGLTVKHEQQKIELTVEAELLAQAEPVSPIIRASNVATATPATAGTADASPTDEPAAPAVKSVVPQELLTDFHLPEGVQLKNVNATAATMEWPATLTTAEMFRLERRRIVPDGDGGIKVQWDPLANVDVTHTGALYTAKLSKLSPGQMYGVRVVAVGPGMEAGQPLFTQYFATPPRPSLMPKITLLRVLVVVLLVCGVFVLRQRRAQRAA
jgi:hypothetical protein